MTTQTSASYYWCYSCTQFIRVLAEQETSVSVACPLCESGFIEKINDLATTESVIIRRLLDRFITSLDHGGDDERAEGEGIGYRFRRVPDFVSESLMGLGISRQLSEIEALTYRSGNPQIKSMPRVKISDCHIAAKADCAVCMECFELDTEAREMPCKHIFHEDCITPWLDIKNSCPICRFQLPSEPPRGMTRFRAQERGIHISREDPSLQGTLEVDNNNAGSGLGSGGIVSRMDNFVNNVKERLCFFLIIIFLLLLLFSSIFFEEREQQA